MVRALTVSDVPKINLVTGSIVGSAYSMMNSKGLGADYVFMWDSANVSIVEPRQATEVIFGKWSSELEQQFRDTQHHQLVEVLLRRQMHSVGHHHLL